MLSVPPIERKLCCTAFRQEPKSWCSDLSIKMLYTCDLLTTCEDRDMPVDQDKLEKLKASVSEYSCIEKRLTLASRSEPVARAQFVERKRQSTSQPPPVVSLQTPHELQSVSFVC